MRYFRTLTLSLSLHIAIALLLATLAPEPRPRSNQITVIDLLETPEPPRRPYQPPRDQGQFVRNTEVPHEILTQEKREKRFASEEERTVLEETQARKSGMTANRGDKPVNQKSASRQTLDLTPISPLEKRQNEFLGEDIDFGKDDIKVGGVEKRGQPVQPDGSRALSLPSFNGVERGLSTVGEALPSDIKFGDFTALNTDRHLYYTFYARMEEMIRHRWIQYARAVLMNHSSEVRPPMGSDGWKTHLEIVLDPQGNFIKAILHESSGVHGLDSAPVQAFRDAKQFPNPPQEMVKEDGTIRLQYTFNVNIVSRFAAGE